MPRSIRIDNNFYAYPQIHVESDQGYAYYLQFRKAKCQLHFSEQLNPIGLSTRRILYRYRAEVWLLSPLCLNSYCLLACL